MRDGEDQTKIGVGGWGLVILSAVITFAVLRGLMHSMMVPSLLFSAAIALIVFLLLHRLAAAVNRYDDNEETTRVRRIVPAAAEMGPGATGAVAVPLRPDMVKPQRPSTVVTPLAKVEAAPVILPHSIAVASEELEPEVVEPAASPAPMPVPEPKSKTAAKPTSKPKAEPKAKVAKAAPAAKAAKPKAEPKSKAEKKPKDAKPQGLVRFKAPRLGKADDLQEIEGIGPALEKLVNALGFYHFDQIAGWTEADVALVDAEMKTFKGRITRDKWVEQARIIVNEGLEAFRERAKTNDY